MSQCSLASCLLAENAAAADATGLQSMHVTLHGTSNMCYNNTWHLNRIKHAHSIYLPQHFDSIMPPLIQKQLGHFPFPRQMWALYMQNMCLHSFDRTCCSNTSTESSSLARCCDCCDGTSGHMPLVPPHPATAYHARHMCTEAIPSLYAALHPAAGAARCFHYHPAAADAAALLLCLLLLLILVLWIFACRCKLPKLVAYHVLSHFDASHTPVAIVHEEDALEEVRQYDASSALCADDGGCWRPLEARLAPPVWVRTCHSNHILQQ